MQELIETEIFNRAHALSKASHTPIEGQPMVDVKQRAEGKFLRELVDALQPMLRESVRSHQILLGTDPRGTIVLESNGIFAHVGIANQHDELDPMQVLRAEPRLYVLLQRIEAELVTADDVRATHAAEIVRLARYAIAAETAAYVG
jgi:hypothetical protein